MMFKITGSIMITSSAIFLSAQKTLKLYFTYKFLDAVSDLIHKILYENSSNLTYGNLFVKLNFNADNFLAESKDNKYIEKKEFDNVQKFIKDLGKRDRESEIKYLEYNLNYFEKQKKIFYKEYIETQKINLLCGFTSGIFISIILI